MTMRDPAALRSSASVALSVVLLVSPLLDVTSYQSVHQYIGGAMHLAMAGLIYAV
jgi:hypothetical protein